MIPIQEELRKMAERVVLECEREEMTVLLLTSPSGGEGVSFVARQFADELSQTHEMNIFLIEAPDSTEGGALSSQETTKLFDSLKEAYDLVLVDAGGMLEKSGSLVYLNYSDAAVMVLKAEQTLREEAREVQTLLERHSVRPIGLVLNGTLDPTPAWFKRKGPRCS